MTDVSIGIAVPKELVEFLMNGELDRGLEEMRMLELCLLVKNALPVEVSSDKTEEVDERHQQILNETLLYQSLEATADGAPEIIAVLSTVWHNVDPAKRYTIVRENFMPGFNESHFPGWTDEDIGIRIVEWLNLGLGG